MITALFLTAVLAASPVDKPLSEAAITKLLKSPSEAERIRALNLVNESPDKSHRRQLMLMVNDDPSHGCRQLAIMALGKIGDAFNVDALYQVGSKHCACEKLAFQSLMKIGRRQFLASYKDGQYSQHEPTAIKAARKLQAGCPNETLKEEMGKELEKREWERQ